MIDSSPLDDVRPFSAQCGGFEKNKEKEFLVFVVVGILTVPYMTRSRWNAPMLLLLLLLCIK